MDYIKKSKEALHAHMDKSTPAIDKFERASIVNEHEYLLTGLLKQIEEGVESLRQDVKQGGDYDLPDGCQCDNYDECTLCWHNRPIKAGNDKLDQVINLIRR
jgi:hypothetical protein